MSVVLPSPSLAGCLEPKTVVSTSVWVVVSFLVLEIAGWYAVVVCTYDFVLASQGDDGALDAEGCGVAGYIASDDVDTAVSGNEGSGGKREDEDLGEHCDWWVLYMMVIVGRCMEIFKQKSLEVIKNSSD